ncbi:MAG: hypothetical protein D6714_18925 [Bacteroidetes bacterium]|nr:MAG: hypothetical protein D6714_18925 [Bacteroidota bacterium]
MFFLGKNVSVFASGRALRMPAIFGFFVRWFRRKKGGAAPDGAQILSEHYFLQRCHPSGVFYSTETRVGKNRARRNLCPPPKANRTIPFFPQKNKAPRG